MKIGEKEEDFGEQGGKGEFLKKRGNSKKEEDGAPCTLLTTFGRVGVNV